MPGEADWRRFDTLRNRLVLLIFIITAAAVGSIYLYVIPQLESSLTAEKLSALESSAQEQAGRFPEPSVDTPIDRFTRMTRMIAGDTETRATLLKLDSSGAATVISDSQRPSEITSLETGFRALAEEADQLDQTVAGVTSTSAGPLATAASPVAEAGQSAVLILSSPLDDVQANVGLIRRQILIAGAIALVAASLVGLWAASSVSRRIERLQRAAERAAEGKFGKSIPVDSNDELGKLASTLNQMQRRLARLDTTRSEFIANASHELRTPIFSLSGYLELLQTGKPSAAERRGFMDEMRTQIDRLETLTANLLDLSKLDAGAMKVERSEVDLSKVARAITKEVDAIAKAHGTEIEIRVSGKPVAAADLLRVEQTVRILVDNAIRHTPSGTKVTITALQESRKTKLIVGDEGPGISARDREKIFERFWTGDQAGGSGLGLPIARELAERMKGSLELSARRGHTAFTLTLPAARQTR
ncbi:MAG: sensor histidine kinase [bacterium]